MKVHTQDTQDTLSHPQFPPVTWSPHTAPQYLSVSCPLLFSVSLWTTQIQNYTRTQQKQEKDDDEDNVKLYDKKYQREFEKKYLKKIIPQKKI